MRKALLGPAWVILLGLVLAGARAQDRPAEAPGGQDAGARGGQAQSSSSRPAASRPRSAAPAPGTEARETDTAPPEEGDSTESPAANDAGVQPDAAPPPVETPPPPGGSVVDALRGRDLFHGNFCGAGSRLGAFDPTDELDAACKRHDECYDLNGRRSCGCDRTLRREALAIANNPQASREIRRRAGVVVQAAELMACEGP